MWLLLRGHVRTAFDRPDLVQCLLQCVREMPDLRIVLHSWNVISTSLSWRNVAANHTPVHESWLLAQLPEEVRARVVACRVDAEDRIVLHGSVTGMVCRSTMPRLGWKRYIAGMWTALETMIPTSEDMSVVSMRFDLFNNSNSLTLAEVMSFLQAHRDWRDPHRLSFARPKCGLDNLFVGGLPAMRWVIRRLHWQLDHVMHMYPAIINQECLVKHVYEEYERLRAAQAA